MKNFNNKVVVITGGATGIGLSFAKQFGSDGAKVVIASRREKVVNEAVEELRELGIEAAGKTCDVTDYTQVEALADYAWEIYGHVDVIMNNAGVSQSLQPIIEMDITSFKKVMDINVYGVLNGIKVFGTRFIDQGTPAAIYNIGSENSYFVGVPSASAYVASKHAVLALTDSLREEVPSFIDVALITPGYVQSEMTEGFPGAMDSDEFVSIIMPQLKAGKFYCVSHAYNLKRINDRYNEVKYAFQQYAPRYDGDNLMDVRTVLAKVSEDAE